MFTLCVSVSVSVLFSIPVSISDSASTSTSASASVSVSVCVGNSAGKLTLTGCKSGVEGETSKVSKSQRTIKSGGSAPYQTRWCIKRDVFVSKEMCLYRKKCLGRTGETQSIRFFDFLCSISRRREIEHCTGTKLINP